MNEFLNELGHQSGEEKKEFAKHLLLKMLPLVKLDDLANLDGLLSYIAQATDTTTTQSIPKPFKVVTDYIDQVEDAGEREFAAYVATRLFDSKTAHNEAELKQVCNFIGKHIVKGGTKTKSCEVDDKAVLDMLEIDNLNTMLRHFSLSSSKNSALGAIEEMHVAE